MELEFSLCSLKELDNIQPKPEYVFVTSMTDFNFVKKFMNECKVISPSLIRGKSSDEVYDIFMNHISELQEVYESLVDEESRRTFRGYWIGCISGQLNEIVYASTPQYICPGFIPKSGDVVIDCGAFDGGTSVRFVNMGCKVYGFEINETNFKIANKLAKERNFVVENLGLGSCKYETGYTDGSLASHLDINSPKRIKITTLDSYVGENEISHVDFIKMDVEGAELDILKGSAITISRFKPILAISAYHKLDDFWTLMNFIKSVRSDYEFAIRQYASKREDSDFPKYLEDLFIKYGLDPELPGYEECVLFAR